MSELRRCRGTWAYCDGDCSRCTTTATTQTSMVYSIQPTLDAVEVRKMNGFVGGEEKIIDVNDQIVFENKTDSNFEVGVGIIFHKSGLYDISISENRVIVTKVANRREEDRGCG